MFMFSTCIQNQSSHYFNEFKTYMSDIHECNILQDESERIYILLPMGCMPCAGKENLEVLINLKDERIVFVILGNSNEPKTEMFSIRNAIKNRFTHYEDNKNKNVYYEMGLSKMLLIHIKGNSCISYFRYNKVDHEEVQNYLSAN